MQTKSIIFAGTVIFCALAPISSQTRPRQALSLTRDCAAGDCPLLSGFPQTGGMRSGFVRLKAGQSVGWHTTGHNEECLIVLRGSGKALIEGHASLEFAAPRAVYVPPTTKHNVTNTGVSPLEYVYVVAPASVQ